MTEQLTGAGRPDPVRAFLDVLGAWTSRAPPGSPVQLAAALRAVEAVQARQ